MYTLKNLPAILGIILLGVGLEVVRRTAGVPVTILDLLLFPIVTVFSLSFLRYEFFNKQNLFEYNPQGPVSAPKRIGFFIVFLLMAAGGAWCLWIGICNPMAYFESSRGSVHGYTMAAFGLLLITMGAFGTLKTVLIFLNSSRQELEEE